MEKVIKITYDDGTSRLSSVAEGVTQLGLDSYFLNQRFNCGYIDAFDNDNEIEIFKVCVAVEFVREDEHKDIEDNSYSPEILLLSEILGISPEEVLAIA